MSTEIVLLHPVGHHCMIASVAIYLRKSLIASAAIVLRKCWKSFRLVEAY